eukprot:14075856-Alexandrium_andersonii.AAC.1
MRQPGFENIGSRRIGGNEAGAGGATTNPTQAPTNPPAEPAPATAPRAPTPQAAQAGAAEPAV